MKWAVAAALLVLGAAIAWWASDETPAPSSPVAVEDSAPAPTSTTAREVEERVAASPPSLRGTDRDGEISWLSDGSVRIDLSLRRRFDHLLSAIGEVTLAQVRSRLQTELEPVASADRVARVMMIFDRYVAYLEAAGRVQPDPDPRKRLAQAHDLRVLKLGAEIARAFYEDEERSDEWAISRRELVQSGATREALAELDEKLPPEARALAKEAAQLQDTVQDTARFDAEGLSAEERRKLREAKVGAEAAARLGQLDDERAQWNARVEAVKAQRGKLDAKQLDALLERDFTEPERRRIRALLAEE